MAPGMSVHFCEHCGVRNPSNRKFCSAECTLWSMTDRPSDDACWLRRNQTRSPTMAFDKKTFRPDRLLFGKENALPDRAKLTHKCGADHCCNPRHMIIEPRAQRKAYAPTARKRVQRSRDITPEHAIAASARFWDLSDKSAGPEGCWLWIGYCSRDGYGRFRVGDASMRAHRIAYMIATGLKPTLPLIMHSCDTPRCVNPRHLSEGTDATNAADKMAKGRHVAPKGPRKRLGAKRSSRHSSKLDADKVRLIRQRRADGISNSRVAAEFGIAPSMVYAIAYRKKWKHVE